jgi:dehydrogenase/reductase SDR family protein 1
VVDALKGRVAVVTGASRGIGKGIALELGAAGATVYLTGRTTAPGGFLPGTIGETAEAVTGMGGRGIGVACDHHDDNQVRALFEQVRAEQGRLDVLVNNVYSSPDLAGWLGKRFWEIPAEAWDQVVGIGSRSHYVAAALGAPLMLETGQGLIANISSPGSSSYMHNVLYGIGKAALDKMTSDMAHELRSHGIAVVSLWPGIVRTELLDFVPKNAEGKQLLKLPGEGVFDLDLAESPRFTGRAVAALAAGTADGSAMGYSGRAMVVADLADSYGFTDVDGRVPRMPVPNA